MKKIIILTPILPYPPDDGSRLRTYQVINFLSEKCEVDLLSFYLHGEDIISAKKFYEKFCKNIFFLLQTRSKFNLISKLFIYFPTDKIIKEINKILLQNNYEAIIVEKLIMLSYLNKKVFKKYKVVLDSWGIDSQITYQLFLNEKNLFRKIFKFLNYIRHLLIEIYLLSKSQNLVAITDNVYYFYKKIFKHKNIYLIPNAVDLNYYKPSDCEIEKGSIVFVGIMNFLPNIDAVNFFVNEVLPKMKNKLKVKFYIVGKNPTQEVLNLHNGSDVIVTGFVDDVREYIWRSEVVVVPLRMGSGLRNKVIQAMACGKVVIATTEACEGLNVKDGENILIADTSDEFVEKIIKVFNDTELKMKIEKNARKYVEENFSYDIIKEKWINMYEEILNNNHNSRQT